MLDSSPIDLCGLSIGALLAMRMALDRPDRVRRLVLCGGFALLPRRLRVLQTLMGGLVTLVPEARLRNQLAASVPSAGREAARSETAGLTRAAIRYAFARAGGLTSPRRSLGSSRRRSFWSVSVTG